jgi:Xaa-Pro aminopeptidase
VGLEVHEAPWLNAEMPSTLAVGNVVTVEPGVYLPGLGGIRIEDLVIVGDGGPEVLTPFTKELVTVG